MIFLAFAAWWLVAIDEPHCDQLRYRETFECRQTRDFATVDRFAR